MKQVLTVTAAAVITLTILTSPTQAGSDVSGIVTWDVSGATLPPPAESNGCHAYQIDNQPTKYFVWIKDIDYASELGDIKESKLLKHTMNFIDEGVNANNDPSPNHVCSTIGQLRYTHHLAIGIMAQ